MKTERKSNFIAALVSAAAASVMVMIGSVAFAGAPTTVQGVQVDRYLGNWYQIAHNPLFFEGGVCDCARQSLTPGEGGLVGVYNSCNKGGPNGKLTEIRGTAHDDDTVNNSKFTVDFHLAFKGTYWIIGLDPEYRFAVVSDKYKYSLYILSKTPELAQDLYEEAVAMAAKQVSTSKLVITNQVGCTYPTAEK